MDFPDTVLKPSPVKNANIISRHFFLWIIPLFYKGYSKDLNQQDLYAPRKSDISAPLGNKLEKAWEGELEKFRAGKSKKPRLVKALWTVFGGHYSMLFILYVITECILRVSQPLFVRYLVQSFSADTDFTERDQYLLAGGVILSTFLVTMFFHPSFHGGFIVAMRCRIACSSLIYRKSLRLSTKSLKIATGGQIVNLLSNDVNRFDLNLLFFPFLFVAPFQLAIFTYFLWEEFGASCLIGIGSVLLMTVMQYWNGKFSTEYRRQIAQRTDSRGQTMNEVITAIRIIKQYAWEKPFTLLIHKLRRLEMSVIRKRSFLRGIYLSTFSSTSKLIPFLTFLLYVLTGNEITAEKLFFTVAVYNAIIQNMMYFIPSAVSGLGEVWIALKRIEDFLLLEERETFSEKDQASPERTSRVELTNVSASWTGAENQLTDINLKGRDGQLIIVCGPIGSSKSTLLQVILRELKRNSGSIFTNGSISYACQEPWIFGGNVRQNILFGRPYDKDKYERVVRVCALLDDFHQFSHGDMTVVSDRGVSLSGGQRARINLARCVYQDSDVYLLDDPLSAVDPKVSRHLFEECVRGYLKDKLVILVTHQLQYLGQADNVVVLNEGKILGQGSLAELTHKGLDFVKLLMTEESEQNEEDKEEKEIVKRVDKPVDKVVANEKQGGQAEKMGQGGIGAGVYWKYFQTGESYFGLFLLFSVCILAQLSITATEYWMSHWSNVEEERRAGTFDEDNYLGENTYLAIYGGLVALILAFNLMRAFGWFTYSYLISVNMHNRMFQSVVRAPTKFFDDNPPGRVMNRFTKDLGQLDEMLPPVYFETSIIFLQMVGVLGIVIASNWIVAPPALLVLIVLWFMRGFFVNTARDIKRIEGVTKSPVFNHAVSSLHGLATIRSSKAQVILVDQFDGLQDFHSSAWFLFLSSTRCFGIWVELVSILFLAIVTFSFLVFNPDSSEGGSVGLAITAAINLTTWFQFAMRQSAEVANYMTSVERTLEYASLGPEASLESKPDKKPPTNWPSSGEIQFQDVSLSYNGRAVLRNLNFGIKSSEKVAIIGRTGAGKSSVIQALFRMTEPTGKIWIDGIEINQLGLHDIRKGISIIPQEPVLFRGTMRYNLDPFDEFEDPQLWEAVEQAGLKGACPTLDFKVEDGGGNFSVGQKQLVCLARAILRKNKILVLDEATANVDFTTDAFIQATVRKVFSHCTIITIAHRLNTVMDSDRIIVMDDGKIIEHDHPWTLLQNENSLLSQIVRSTGKTNISLLLNLAKDSFTRRGGAE